MDAGEQCRGESTAPETLVAPFLNIAVSDPNPRTVYALNLDL